MNKNAHRNAEDSRSRRAMVGSKLSFSASESYKLLRTNVMFSLAEDEDGSRIFGITSPIKGEGKSTTAINLAYSIAESAKRVLLIEMDMRLPVLHKSLPISKAPGLSDLLVGSALLTDALQKSGIHDDLYVITAGNLPPNPSELLGSERMKALLESFRERFDYILCDLPPITVVSDALMISPMLSGMIVVVRKNYTDMRALDVTMRQLEFTQVKVLGFVMTFDDSGETGAKRYRYGSKYGYKYSYRYDYGYYAAAEKRRREEDRRKNSSKTSPARENPEQKP